MKTKSVNLTMFIACLCCFIMALSIVGTNADNLRSTMQSEYHLSFYNDGWMSEGKAVATGTTIDTNNNELTITNTIFPEELGENVMFFSNERQPVAVYADDELLFSYGMGSYPHKLSATNHIPVRLPEKGHDYTVKVTFRTQNGQCTIPTFRVGSLNDVILLMFTHDIMTFASIPILALVSIMLMIVSILMYKEHISEPRVFGLTMFYLIAVCWSIYDTEIVCLLNIDMELITTITHYMLLMMPLPMHFFLRKSCAHYELKYAGAIHSLILANFFVQTALFLLNICSLHDMLTATQVLIFGCMFYGAIAATIDYRTKPSVQGMVLAGNLYVCSAMGIGTILAYWLSSGTVLYHTFFQLTLYIFMIGNLTVIMLSLGEYKYDLRLSSFLSEVDQITGIGNRKAFDKKLNAVYKNTEKYPNPTLVFMDINGLKYTNDTYGHEAGDALLITAAKCISRSFEGQGTAYRIGGDEFAVICDNTSHSLVTCYRQMDTFVSEYNVSSDVPLSIARGSSPVMSDNRQRLTMSDWKMLADKAMYEDKAINRRGHMSENARDYLEIISSFVNAVDAKDTYTANHSSRVAQMTDYICQLIGMSDTQMNQIHIAASLHDIGKIAVPDSILLKDSGLTDEERKTMQTHPVRGEQIMKATPAFYDVSKMIRHHHERYDGSGYPDGLAGTDIPLGSRIIAIADSIDAMTSTRSYRKALSIDICRSEIEKNLGTMYDKAIASLVLENWEGIEEIISKSE